jgi:glycerol transport system ATP-binding protein
MRVRLENITKYYGREKVLDKVSVNIEEGSVFGLLGPTGAGKTTLMRIIAGTEKPSEGRVYFNDEDVTDVPPQKRDVSMVFQSFALYPNMNVYDNIANPLKMKKMPPPELDKRVKTVASILGLEKLLDRRVQALSGGEQQRVALARARAKNAQLNLMDEPLTNLDYKLREGMREEIKRAIGGTTTIYATPDPLDVLAISTHVGIIFNGRLIQTGTVKDVYLNPRDISVAQYFSYPYINFFDAQLVEIDGRSYLALNEETRLDVTHIKGKLTGGKYILGVRGSDLYDNKVKPNMISMKLPVSFCEYTGSETTIHFTYKERDIRMWIGRIVEYPENKEVKIYMSPEDIFIFDESGQFISRCIKAS